MTGKMIIFSAPSGAGKTTIVRHLLEQVPRIEFSVSACTREARKNEVDGKDYYFLSPETFRKKISKEEFVEWEEVYPGQYYGTLKSELWRIWAKGYRVIFDVDVVGGLNLKKKFPDTSLAIFVMPPSIEELEKRLQQRSTDSPEKIRARVDKAEKEMEYAGEFDQIIINDKLEDAKREAISIVKRFLTGND